MVNQTTRVSKFFGVLLAAILFLSALPVWAQAEEPTPPDPVSATSESAPSGSSTATGDGAPAGGPADGTSSEAPSGEQPAPDSSSGTADSAAPPEALPPDGSTAPDEPAAAPEYPAAESGPEELPGAQEADDDGALLSPQDVPTGMSDPGDPDTIHILTNPPIPNYQNYYGPEDALSKYDIRLGGLSDGTQAMLRFAVNLNPAFLENMRGQYIQSDVKPGNPLIGPEDFDEQKAQGGWAQYANYDAYLNDLLPQQAGFTSPYFSCTFNDDEIKPPTPVSPATGFIGPTDASGNPNGPAVGTYTWVHDDVNHTWKLTGTFYPCVVNKVVVELLQTFGLLNIDDGNDGGSVTITPGDTGGGPLVNVHFDGPPDDLADPDSYYHIDKSVVNSGGKTGGKDTVGDSFVEYRVLVSADADDGAIVPKLNGKNISDALPDVFWLDGVDIQCYKELANDVTSATTPLTFTPSVNDTITYTTTPFTLDGANVDEKTGFSCTLPALASDKSNLIKTAVITYRVRLTQDATVAYLTNPASGAFGNIENDAVLSRADKGGAPTVPITDGPATVDMSAGFFQKNGQQLAGNNSVFQWSLEVNCYGVGANNIFVFDTLEISEHNYITDGSYPITLVDKADPAFTRTLQMAGGAPLDFGASPPDFASLQNSSLPFPAGSPFAAVTGTTYGYYTYTEDGRQMAMLVFNTQAFFNRDIEITYYTKVPQAAAELDPDASVRNDAKLIYDTLSYTGGGTPPGNPTDVNVNYNLTNNPPIAHKWVDKKGAGYNPDTQIITWMFQVNEFSTALDYLTITDTLANSGQHFLLADTHGDITLTERGGATRAVPYNASGLPPADLTDPANTDYYTLVDDGAETTLTVYLFGIAETQYYTFPLYTKLVDTSYLTRDIPATGLANAANSVPNTAQVVGKPAGRAPKPQDTDAGGTQRIVNALIGKAVDPANKKFDYADYSTSWQITLNPNHLPVTNLAVADILPKGSTFLSLVSVKRYDTGGNLVSSAGSPASPIYTVSGPGAAVADEPVALTLAGSGTDSVGLSLTTDYQFTDVPPFTGEDRLLIAFADADATANPTQVFTDKYVIVLKAAFTHANYRNACVDVVNPPKITNACAYIPASGANQADGSAIYGAPLSASASATSNPVLPPISKAGKYFVVQPDGTTNGASGQTYPAVYAGASGVHWEICVNRYANDMPGWRVTDDLKAFFELYTPSFEIYAATVDLNGAFTATGPNLLGSYAEGDPFFPALQGCYATGSGFSFLIPAAYGNTPLIVKFDTLFVDDAKRGTITNDAVLSNNQPGGEIPTGDVGNPSWPSFNLDDFCRTTSMPYVMLRKHSSSSTGGTSPLCLEGAVFELVSVPRISDGFLTPQERIRITNESGRAAFLFLTPNILYRIIEEDAPLGYHVTPGVDDVHYLYVQDDKPYSDADYFDGSHPKPTPFLLEILSVSGPQAATGLDYSLENTPGLSPNEGDDAFLEFKKVDADGLVFGSDLAGAAFRLYRAGVYDETLTTGADGKVKFENLDPNVEYTLTETGGPGTALPFQAPPLSWAVKITVAGAGTQEDPLHYEVSLDGVKSDSDHATPNAKGVSFTLAGGFIIENRYLDRPVQLTKNDADAATAVSNAEFTIYVAATPGSPNPATDQKVAYLVEGTTKNGVYHLSNKNLAGTAFPSLPGDGTRSYLRPKYNTGGTLTGYHLLAGTYYFVETVTPKGFQPDEASAGVARTHAFTVNSASPATLHLTNTGVSSAGSARFTNQCRAAAVLLNKVDRYSQNNSSASQVHGAEFMVYELPAGGIAAANPAADTLVAYLVEQKTGANPNGTYALSPTNSGGVAPVPALDTQTKPAGAAMDPGAPYLFKHGTGWKLLFGNYYFVETTTPTGYQPDYVNPATPALGLNARVFTVGAGNSNADCYLSLQDNPATNATSGITGTSFGNQALTAPLALTKVDAILYAADPATAHRVHGAQFTVYAQPAAGPLNPAADKKVALLNEVGATGEYRLTQLTGAPAKDVNGRFYLQEISGDALNPIWALLFGDYYFVETTAPTGYFPDSANPLAPTPVLRTHSFTVAATDTLFLSNAETGAASADPDTVFENQYIHATARLNKRDSYDTGVALPGAEFTVYQMPASGQIPQNPANGDKVAYLLDNDGDGVYDVLSPFDADGMNPIAPPLDADGRACLYETAPGVYSLLRGDYYFVESKAPTNYQPDTDSLGRLNAHRFGVTAGGVVTLSRETPELDGTTVIFANTNPAAGLELIKVGEDDPGARVHGAEFTVYVPAGAANSPTPSATFPVAYLVEQLDDALNPTGRYHLSPLDATGGDGAGLDFGGPGQALDADGRAYLQEITLSGGVTSYKLIFGDYCFEESVTPPGFLPDESAPGVPRRHSFALDTGGLYHLTNAATGAAVYRLPTAGGAPPVFTNDCTSAAVLLQKRDAFSQNAPVSGAEFTVYLDDGGDPAVPVAYLRESGATPGLYALAPLDETAPDALLRRHGPDSAPTWNLEFGAYFYTETTTPYGYHPDAGQNGNPVRHGFTVDAHGVLYLSNGAVEAVYGDSSLIFTNTAMRAPVLLNKADSETAALLSGAEFTVYDSDGGTPAAYLAEETDKNGKGTGRYALSAESAHGGASLAGAANAAGRAYLQTDAAGDLGITLGRYYFAETTTPEGYAPDKTRHPFRVRTEDTLYLANNAQDNFSYPADTSALSSDEIALLDAQAGATVFTNRYIMAEVALDKRGSDTNAPLSGAEFKVYAAGSGKLVAYLSETQNTAGQDMYMLSPNSLLGGARIPAVAAPDGRNYLNAVVSGSTTVYELVYDRYYFTETTAPDGYLPETGDDGTLTRHYFDVDEEGLLYLSNDDTLSGYQRGILFLNDPILPDSPNSRPNSPASSTPAPSSAGVPTSGQASGGVQTGDRAPIALLIAIAVLTLAGLGTSVGIILARRRSGGKDSGGEKGGTDGPAGKDVWKKPKE